ncbi:MAG: mechanosensitive ion channel domain-containing protein [Acholeplasmataceae bacterium]
MEELRKLIQTFLENKLFLSPSVALIIRAAAIIILWLIIGYLLTFVNKFITHRIIRRRKHKDQRTETITKLINSVIHFVFWFFIVVMILLELGIEIAPILASAGILAFAVGFGSQELIKDLLSGFFIIFEHSFDVGDMIEHQGFKGRVIEIGLRKTKIKNWKNEIKLVNNGDIRTVINYSIGESIGVVEFGVAYGTDLDLFINNDFQELLIKFNEDNENVVKTPSYAGIVALTEGIMTLRVTFEAKNNQHVGLERDLRLLIMKYCEQHDVKHFFAKLIVSS